MRLFYVCLCLSGLVCSAADNAANVIVTDPATGAVVLRHDKQSCWTYHPQSTEGKPYFHPLTIPGTDEAFTAFRPEDHRWHLGFWFSWKYINGCNFWEPDTNGVTQVVTQTLSPSDDAGSFRADSTLAYLTKGREAVREQRTVTVVTQPSGDYSIEWDSTFTAIGAPATFSTSPVTRDAQGRWAQGGYAGLMLRLADSPAFTYTYTNDAGKKDVGVCGEPSDRITIIATSSATGARAKLTFIDHPENPRHPTPWFARYSLSAHKNRGYYLVGPSPCFHEPLTLAADAAVRFRYTLIVERLPGTPAP